MGDFVSLQVGFLEAVRRCNYRQRPKTTLVVFLKFWARTNDSVTGSTAQSNKQILVLNSGELQSRSNGCRLASGRKTGKIT